MQTLTPKILTWNPIIGCNKVSSGCKNCYAQKMANRLQAMGHPDYKGGFTFRMLPERLDEPKLRKIPTLYFLSSMSDVFHEKMELNFLDSIMKIITATPHHQYLILTKRPQRMKEYFCGIRGHLSDGIKRKIPKNVWLGTTIESAQLKYRIDILKSIQAPLNWLCCEPLISDLGELDLTGISWVVAGGENAPKAREIRQEWVLSLKNQCDQQNVAFFFKQWGSSGEGKEKNALIGGKLYQEFPKQIHRLHLYGTLFEDLDF